MRAGRRVRGRSCSLWSSYGPFPSCRMDLPRFISGIGSRRRCTFWLLALSAATASALTGGCQRNAGPAVAGAVWQTEPADLDPNGDADGDALDDTLEDRLAERFAPIVFHGDRETAFPVSVETWLRHSSLGLAVNGRWVRRVVGGPLTQPQLVNQRTSVGEVALASTGARSRGKRESFVLEPIEAVNRPGPLDSTDWVTYVHSYRNGHDGVTLQDRRGVCTERRQRAWGRPRTWRRLGGNCRAPRCAVPAGADDLPRSFRHRRRHHEHEVGGQPSAGVVGRGQPLELSRRHSFGIDALVSARDVDRRSGHTLGRGATGRQRRPPKCRREVAPAQPAAIHPVFRPVGAARAIVFITTGYWGPAFNETGATCADGSSAYRPYLWRRADSQRCSPIRINAWCDGADPTYLDLRAECFALSDVP